MLVLSRSATPVTWGDQPEPQLEHDWNQVLGLANKDSVLRHAFETNGILHWSGYLRMHNASIMSSTTNQAAGTEQLLTLTIPHLPRPAR